MLTLPVNTLVAVVGGELVHGPDSTVVNGLSIDTRDLLPGAVFVAFRGEKVDGHDFVGDALERGARALLVTRWDEALKRTVSEARRREAAVVLVDDPLTAVQALAAHHRGRMPGRFVGVTGSTGKTTTKDMLSSVLTRKFKIVATEGNRNNELGVPLTLFRAGVETEVCVIEMAMRGPGQIARLCEIASPTHGLVTNVGQTHLELLRSEAAIASAKAELVRSVPEDGAVFLNGDDAWTDTLANGSDAQVTRYGLGEGNDVRAVDVETDEEGRPCFRLRAEGGEVPVRLTIPGRHNAYNAAAAAAVALSLGATLDDCRQGLEAVRLSPMRMEVFTSAAGFTIINDAYNASPTSMRAALQALADISSVGRKVAVLGDMAELGSLAELAHFELGEEVGRVGLDGLLTVGPRAAHIADGARAEGLEESRIRSCETVDEARELLDELVRPGDAVLVKASRVMGLEKLVDDMVQPDVQS